MRSPFKRLLGWIFVVSLILLVFGFFQRNEFASNMTLQPGVMKEPLQEPVDKSPFTITSNDVNYQVSPLFDYDITGLVVSYEHHSGEYGSHARWNDHINVVDICMVWMDNAATLDLNAFTFRNGQFTCFLETESREAYEQFKGDQLSNNHLITDNDHIRNTIDKLRIGDQVRIRGWLATYSNDRGGSRGTSTNRTDTGNGACETIYVRDFYILDSMSTPWRQVMRAALVALIGSVLLWFWLVSRESQL